MLKHPPGTEPRPESREAFEQKKDLISGKTLQEKRRWWTFLTRESTEAPQVFQFYLACPDEELEDIVLYLEEGLGTTRLPDIELAQDSGSSEVIEGLRVVLQSPPPGDAGGAKLAVVHGFTELFSYSYLRDERSGRVGHDYNQEVAEHHRLQAPLPLAAHDRLIVITHIRYVPDSVEDHARLSLEAIGSAASSLFANDIIEIDPPDEVRRLQSDLE